MSGQGRLEFKASPITRLVDLRTTFVVQLPIPSWTSADKRTPLSTLGLRHPRRSASAPLDDTPQHRPSRLQTPGCPGAHGNSGGRPAEAQLRAQITYTTPRGIVPQSVRTATNPCPLSPVPSSPGPSLSSGVRRRVCPVSSRFRVERYNVVWNGLTLARDECPSFSMGIDDAIHAICLKPTTSMPPPPTHRRTRACFRYWVGSSVMTNRGTPCTILMYTALHDTGYYSRIH